MYNMSKYLFFFFLLAGQLIRPSFTSAQIIKENPLPNLMKEVSAAKRSPIIKAEFYKEVVTDMNARDWAISVRPTFSKEHEQEDLSVIKKQKLQLKSTITAPSTNLPKSVSAVTPVLGQNFEANRSRVGTPPDNHIAISNNSNIVSVNNDGIEYYNANGSSTYTRFWSGFFNDATLTSILYDPRVIYDSEADRFVMVVLHGSTPATSRVLVCFSKSNNPLNGWWIYKLTGNPLDNNTWFDYPALGVSNNDIFITGNLFTAGKQFNQAVIYQIAKAPGYSGAPSLSFLTWSNLSSDPYAAFSLVPASYGHSGNYGPGIYLVSSNAGGGNTIRLWNITNSTENNPDIQSGLVTTRVYSPAGDAKQLGTTFLLDNGDCRIQNAFYLNGIVHYVLHSDIGGGWNGIIYNRLNVNNLTNQFTSFGAAGIADYAYPSLASFSTATTDKSVMITFLRSSAATYPSVMVVNCDDNFGWSAPTVVKEGESFIKYFSNPVERWGDYTNIVRKHNSTTPRVWLSASYGSSILEQENMYITRIAEVFSSATTSVTDIPTTKKISIYPNPSYQLINVDFDVLKAEKINIRILDQSGRIVRTLYEDVPSIGENRLVFNKGALSKGIYLINISTERKMIKNEKIVILD